MKKSRTNHPFYEQMCPVVMKTGVWKQRSIEGMIRVVMREHHICDGCRRFTQRGERCKHGTLIWKHTWINDDFDSSIADKADRRCYPAYRRCLTVFGIASKEDMNLC